MPGGGSRGRRGVVAYSRSPAARDRRQGGPTSHDVSHVGSVSRSSSHHHHHLHLPRLHLFPHLRLRKRAGGKISEGNGKHDHARSEPLPPRRPPLPLLPCHSPPPPSPQDQADPRCPPATSPLSQQKLPAPPLLFSPPPHPLRYPPHPALAPPLHTCTEKNRQPLLNRAPVTKIE